ncbi:hypothetical protein CALCODRAFT_355526 [Calocera cornea HHB12733]|uniref:F-box domain-containing protein n=1 Tax=Calocera cornea HHB12733 TaxID=1353952 RepID=A0A165EPS9_9BASI|nr:hypothetical protein CALCODRAFT_355526 [Calocera cornea HHB12733]
MRLGKRHRHPIQIFEYELADHTALYQLLLANYAYMTVTCLHICSSRTPYRLTQGIPQLDLSLTHYPSLKNLSFEGCNSIDIFALLAAHTTIKRLTLRQCNDTRLLRLRRPREFPALQSLTLVDECLGRILDWSCCINAPRLRMLNLQAKLRSSRWPDKYVAIITEIHLEKHDQVMGPPGQHVVFRNVAESNSFDRLLGSNTRALEILHRLTHAPGLCITYALPSNLAANPEVYALDLSELKREGGPTVWRCVTPLFDQGYVL